MYNEAKITELVHWIERACKVVGAECTNPEEIAIALIILESEYQLPIRLITVRIDNPPPIPGQLLIEEIQYVLSCQYGPDQDGILREYDLNECVSESSLIWYYEWPTHLKVLLYSLRWRWSNKLRTESWLVMSVSFLVFSYSLVFWTKAMDP